MVGVCLDWIGYILVYGQGRMSEKKLNESRRSKESGEILGDTERKE